MSFSTSSSLPTFPEKNAKHLNQQTHHREKHQQAQSPSRRQTDTTAASLGSLPAAILVEILSSAQSIQDLQSLLLSSRSLYSAFQPYRCSITLPVVKAELGAANWRIFLSIFHLSHGLYSPRSSPTVTEPNKTRREGGAFAATGTGTNNDTQQVDGPVGKERLQLFVDHYRSNRPFDHPPNNAASFGQAMRIYKIYNDECGSFRRRQLENFQFLMQPSPPPLPEIPFPDAAQQAFLLGELNRRLNNPVNKKMQLRFREEEWRQFRLFHSALDCRVKSVNYYDRIYLQYIIGTYSIL
ncbi:hypothetical protein V8F33_005863 [Rhypophila sp. PSN 637]